MPPTKKFRIPGHTKENENPLADTKQSKAPCPDCGKHVESRRSHQALCGRKTVECVYPSLTCAGSIPVTLHRVNRKFTCWRCDKVLQKDSSMRAHTRQCTSGAATAGVTTEREAQDSVEVDESHNLPQGTPLDRRRSQPTASSTRLRPRTMNQNAGLGGVKAQGVPVSGDQVDCATETIGPGTNAIQSTTSPTPRPQARIEVSSPHTFSRSLDTMAAAENDQEETSCDTSLVEGDEDVEMDLLGYDMFDDECDAQLEDYPAFGFPGYVGTQENDDRGDPTCDAKGNETPEVDSPHTTVPPSTGETCLPFSLLPRDSRPVTCTYKGFVCRCVADDHFHDSSLPSDSIAHVDEACKILCSLNLKFHTNHRYLICTCLGGSFLAFCDLKSHLKKHHKEDLRDEDTRTMQRDFKYVVEHISASFGILDSQIARNFSKEEFDGPIAGIKQPLICYLCPLKGCASFLTNQGSVITHFKSHRSGRVLELSKLKSRWTQFPFISRGSHSARVEVSRPEGPPPPLPSPDPKLSQPPIGRYIAPQGVETPGSPWLHNVGWTTWRDEQLKDHTVPRLCDMVSLPKKISKYQSQASDEKVLYLISSWIQGRAVKMLQDAHAWVAGSELQTAITADSHSHYRPLRGTSWQTYARSFQKLCMFAIRRETTVSQISTIQYPKTIRQEEALNALTTYVLDPDSSPPELNCDGNEYQLLLDELLFEVLESLFYHKLVPISGITSLTDLILMLLWLKQDGSAVAASHATHHCAIFQHWAYTAVIHTIRLRLKGLPRYYEHVRGSESSVGNFGLLQADEVERLLNELRQYITVPKGPSLHFTPFTHLKFFWLKAKIASDNERSLAKLLWSTDGKSFEYSRPRLSSLKIQFSAIRELVHSNLSQLHKCFEQLLPSAFPISKIMALHWNELHDDASSTQSFLDDPACWKAWMNDAINELKQAYLDPLNERQALVVNGEVRLEAVDGLIALDQRFQDALIVDIISNTGISPRAVTLDSYLYRTRTATPKKNLSTEAHHASTMRHLYLMDGQLALNGGRQKGESRRDGYRELVVRTLCPRTQSYLLPYLALIRAALTSILRDNQWYLDLADMYETDLIAYKAKGSARGISRITGTWYAVSEQHFGAELSIVDKRQIDDGVHKRLFPELLRARRPEKTAVHGQGDHGAVVCANNYGRSGNLCGGLSALELNDYIDASNVHHALMQTGPVNHNWPQHILQAVPFRRGYHEELAMDTASVLIPHYYGFPRHEAEETCEAVKQICSDLTFLFHHNSGKPTVYLEDQLLVAIVAKLAWGESSPNSFSVLPHGAEDVVDGSIIILRALDQWTTGEAILRLPKHNSQLQIRYASLKASLMPRLSQFLVDEPHKWETFLCDVREPRLIEKVYLDPTLLHKTLAL